MGFGIDLNIKVEVPKVDVASAVGQATGAIAGAVAGAVSSAESAVAGAVGAATAAAKTATNALSSVAGAIAEVACNFTGAIEDLVLEPHLQLEANASYGETKFEKGPIVIFVEYTTQEANQSTETLHLFCESGAYDEKKSISAFSEDSEQTIGIVFEDAPMSEKFCLEVIEGDGAKHTMFTAVPYGDLRKSRQRYLISEEDV